MIEQHERCRIGPVAVCVAGRHAALSMIVTMLDRDARKGGDVPRTVAFCNAHTVNLARRDPTFVAALDRALVLNDGVGLDLARKALYGAPFPDNLNGTDLTTAVMEAAPGPLRIFLLGSPPGVAERAVAVLRERFPHHSFVGARHGFFDPAEGWDIALAIAETGADLVLLGTGQPRQEKWAAEHGAATGAMVMCIGAYLDFTAGVVRRAPQWVQRARLEWLVRLAQEPRRLGGRYLIGNGRFLLDVAADYLRARTG